MNVLYVVIPCFNEEEVLPKTYKAMKEKMVELINKCLKQKRKRYCLR